MRRPIGSIIASALGLLITVVGFFFNDAGAVQALKFVVIGCTLMLGGLLLWIVNLLRVIATNQADQAETAAPRGRILPGAGSNPRG